MAQLDFVFSEYRPCLVHGNKALFHRWADRARVVPAGLTIGSHPAGQLWDVVGIVEYEDGTVHEAYPYEIRFIDNKISKYCFNAPPPPEKREDTNVDK